MRAALSASLFLIGFALFGYHAFPSLSVGDAGEFATAAATLGIPHPSGFPTYTVLANLFHQLIPWGTAAYHTNLFSALCGAAATFVLFRLLLALGVSNLISILFAAAFLGVRAHRAYSQATEVFELHLLFCGAVLWAMARNRFLLAAFLLGVGGGNHQTIILMLPILAWWRWRQDPPPAVREILGSAAAFATGLSVNLFLLLRSPIDPFLNCGRPDTVERWWRVLTRADYGTLTLALGETPARSLSAIAQHFKRFSTGMVDEAGWLGAIGVLLAAAAFSKRVRSAPPLLLGFLLTGLFFFILGNLPFNAQSTGLLQRFYIVPLFFWFALMALGAQALVPTNDSRWTWSALLVLPLVLLGAGEASSNRRDFRAYAYGLNNLRSLPPKAVFIMDGGDDTFYTTAYLHAAARRRPDVSLHDRLGVVFRSLYGEDFRRLPPPQKDERRQVVERSIAESGRPLLYSTMNPEILGKTALFQQGLLYGTTQPLDRRALWAIYDLTGVAPWARSSSEREDDYRLRALLPIYAYQRAVAEADAAQYDPARLFAQSAQAQASDVLWLAPNLQRSAHFWAYKAFQSNKNEIAQRLYESLVRWNPLDADAWGNLGTLHEQRGALRDAEVCQRQAIAVNPRSANAHFNLGATLWRQGRWAESAQAFQAAVDLNPTFPNAAAFLARARQAAGR
jgi:Flp pilus assembly protein TadD